MNVDDELQALGADSVAAPTALTAAVLDIPSRQQWWQALLQPTWQAALTFAAPLVIGFLLGANDLEDGYELQTLIYEAEVAEAGRPELEEDFLNDV